MKLSDIAIDLDSVENGVWVRNLHEFDADLKGWHVKARGANNKDWRKMASRLLAAVPRGRRTIDGFDPEEVDKMNVALLVNCGIIDWEGLENNEGQPVPYSKDQAQKIFSDPMYRFMFDGAFWACGEVARKRQAEQEADVKN